VTSVMPDIVPSGSRVSTVCCTSRLTRGACRVTHRFRGHDDLAVVEGSKGMVLKHDRQL